MFWRGSLVAEFRSHRSHVWGELWFNYPSDCRQTSLWTHIFIQVCIRLGDSCWLKNLELQSFYIQLVFECKGSPKTWSRKRFCPQEPLETLINQACKQVPVGRAEEELGSNGSSHFLPPPSSPPHTLPRSFLFAPSSTREPVRGRNTCNSSNASSCYSIVEKEKILLTSTVEQPNFSDL